MAIDYSTLTMGEIATIESLSGQSIGALEDQDSPKGLALAALAYVGKLREDKSFTWNDAQALTLTEVTELLGLNEETAPKAGKSSSSSKTD